MKEIKTNKPHNVTTLDDYKAYAFHIREDAKSRGIENTRLSIYGIYMAVVEKQDTELRDVISNLLIVIGNHTGEEIKCNTITEKKWIADAVALKDGKA